MLKWLKYPNSVIGIGEWILWGILFFKVFWPKLKPCWIFLHLSIFFDIILKFWHWLTSFTISFLLAGLQWSSWLPSTGTTRPPRPRLVLSSKAKVLISPAPPYNSTPGVPSSCVWSALMAQCARLCPHSPRPSLSPFLTPRAPTRATITACTGSS